jgi:hypothetical protein
LLSLLTGLKIIPGPDSVGIALAFYTLIILPGILLSDLMFGGAKVDFEGITRIFLTGLSCACLFVCIGFIPGVTYSFIAISYVTAIVIALAYRGIATGKEEEERGVDLVGSFSRREDYSAREKKAMLVVFIFLFGICAALFAGNGELGWNTDAPDHISFVRRSLDGGGLLPGDSFHIDGDGATFDPRKGLWHPVVSLWAWLADTPPHVLWTMMPAFLSFFAIVVFWFFAGELSGSIPVKTLSVLFLFLFFRGDGFAWLTKLSYSRNIAQIVFWGTSGFLIRYLRSQKGKDLGIAALAAAAGTAIHISFAPVLGLFLLGLMVYVSILRLGSDWMSRFWKAVPLVSAAVAFPLAVRLINFPDHPNMIHTHMQGMMEIGAGLRMVDPAELIAGMGFPFLFAVLMIPVFPVITSSYRRSRLVWLLFTIPTLLVLVPLTATPLDMAAGYMHYRLIYAAPAMVYLALAVFGAGRGALTGSWKKGGLPGSWKQRTAVHLAGALVFVLFAAVFLKPSAASLPGRLSSTLIDSKNKQIDRGEELAEFLSVIPEGSVVAADPVSSYYISAFTDHYVTVVLDQHCSPADTSAMTRIKRARDIFSPGLPDSLVLERLTAGRADYLFVDALQGNMDDFFGVLSQESGVRSMIRFGSCGFLKEIRTKGTMKLFAIDASIPAILKEYAAEIDTCSGSLDVPACEEIVLEGFDIETTALSPGDTAVIALCWTSTGETEFGLPFYWTVRFETGFSKGSFYRKWYGKQYRRRVERSRGELYRYTVSGRLAGEGRQPDMWKAGEKIRQEIRVRIPAGMADGEYSVGITLERRTYLPNRRITDYFLNEDSYTGFKAGKVTIRK